MDTTSILRTVLAEHGRESDSPQGSEAWIRDITAQLEKLDDVPVYTSSSSELGLVSFRCMLQDTGYPPEIYQVEEEYRERWVGWAIEVPGQIKPFEGASSHAEEEKRTYPETVQRKFPLRDQRALGAVIKVYGDVAYKPSSTHNFIGVLSTSALPEEDEVTSLPAIHVLATREYSRQSATPPSESRDKVIDLLASAFSPPDATAAELLLLSLLAHPVARQPVVGGLTLNLIGKPEGDLQSILESIVPIKVSLPISISMLHTEKFEPNALNSTSLEAGLLQLAQGTLLVVDETGLGDGGKLDEKAYTNLRALHSCLADQRLRYLYPYMENLYMDCSVKGLILSERSSLTPADIRLPVTYASTPSESHSDLETCRAYIDWYSSPKQAASFSITDETAALIQGDFVSDRQTGALALEQAETTLKRRMKIARLLAISHEQATLTPELWRRCVALDDEMDKRLSAQ